MIHLLVGRFCKQCSVCDLPRAGRPHSSVILENVERVKGSIEECSGTSTRRRSAENNMARTTLQRILHNLHLFPYKIQLVHELKPTEYQESSIMQSEFKNLERFCIWMASTVSLFNGFRPLSMGLSEK